MGCILGEDEIERSVVWASRKMHSVTTDCFDIVKGGRAFQPLPEGLITDNVGFQLHLLAQEG